MAAKAHRTVPDRLPGRDMLPRSLHVISRSMGFRLREDAPQILGSQRAWRHELLGRFPIGQEIGGGEYLSTTRIENREHARPAQACRIDRFDASAAAFGKRPQARAPDQL